MASSSSSSCCAQLLKPGASKRCDHYEWKGRGRIEGWSEKGNIVARSTTGVHHHTWWKKERQREREEDGRGGGKTMLRSVHPRDIQKIRRRKGTRGMTRNERERKSSKRRTTSCINGSEFKRSPLGSLRGMEV